MGLFNTLLLSVPCPLCGVTQEREVQFKYGHRWQYRYRVRDTIRLDPDEKDAPDATIDGTVDCTVCETEGMKCRITLRNAVIVGAEILPALWPRVTGNAKGTRGRRRSGRKAKT